MAGDPFAGHHCKVCYEQAMKEKKRFDALLRDERRQLVKAPPLPADPPSPPEKNPSPCSGAVFLPSPAHCRMGL